MAGLAMAVELVALALMVLGTGFFLAGTVGMLRFPDAVSRLHALTKADNLGLGLIVLGLALQADSLASIVKLGLVWLLAILAAGATAQLVARSALQRQGPPGGKGQVGKVGQAGGATRRDGMAE